MNLTVRRAFAQEGAAPEHGGGEPASGAHEGAASEHGGGEHEVAIPWDNLTISGLNLLIFLGILLWFVRRPISDALHARANRVRHALDESARLQDEARARYADMESKLQTLDRRIDELKAEAQAEANAEAARLAERADADAARVQDTATRTIREEVQRARNEIRREAVEIAAQMAREHLRRSIGPEDHARLAREFLTTVGDSGPRGDA